MFRFSSFRIAAVHGLRIGILGAILLLMNLKYQQIVAQQRAAGLETVPIAKLKELFPEATQLGQPESHGGRSVLAGDIAVGSVLQTFPDASRFLGFSGPTNCLIGFDPNGVVVGVCVIASRDTRDHVELLNKSPTFFKSWNGLAYEDVPKQKVDAVSGATLTSLAIVQGIQNRFGVNVGSLKFPEEFQLADAQKLFPNAASIERDPASPESLIVRATDKKYVGTLLTNSPVADELVGYQGPTLACIGIDADGAIVGLLVLKSFDNEPYVGYVRGDDWFREIFNKKSFAEWAKTSWQDARIEGVAGATMTSQTVAEGILQAIVKKQVDEEHQQIEQHNVQTIRWKVASSIVLIAFGLLFCLKSVRRLTWLRKIYQVLLVIVLGVINGDLLSMAMFVGWSQSGIPWTNALSLVFLAGAALLIPVAFKTNVYCDHLCPHGALQQLMPRRLKLKHRPRWFVTVLKMIVPALLIVIVASPILVLNLSLVDLEPFDAYVWKAAGWATITVAVVGLIFSLFIPMGYCSFGCPTGAVLGYLRRHSRSDRVGRTDLFAIGLLALAMVCFQL